MLRRTLAAVAVLLLPGLAQPGHAQDWKSTIKEFRVGILGGENTQDRLKSYEGFKKLLEERLGVPVNCSPPPTTPASCRASPPAVERRNSAPPGSPAPGSTVIASSR